MINGNSFGGLLTNGLAFGFGVGTACFTLKLSTKDFCIISIFVGFCANISALKLAATGFAFLSDDFIDSILVFIWN
jgi:hypothetical protein